MNGKRYSRQRELIYQTLMETDQHPTAEMVYHWLKPTNPNLSLGTVYRNLNLLADEGTISRMSFPVERYDANTQPHAHLKCQTCGKVYDIHLAHDQGICDKAIMQSGHQIVGYDLTFQGECVHCKTVH